LGIVAERDLPHMIGCIVNVEVGCDKPGMQPIGEFFRYARIAEVKPIKTDHHARCEVCQSEGPAQYQIRVDWEARKIVPIGFAVMNDILDALGDRFT
jgi:hypothetical protein